MSSRAAQTAEQTTDIDQLPRPDGRFWLPDAIVRKLRCSCHVKAVLLVLYSHADSFGESFPGISLIAEESGMGARKARQSLKQAEELGLIIIKRANGTHSTYKVTSPELWPLADSGSAESAACGAVVESKNEHSAACGAAPPRHVVPPKEDPCKEEKSKSRVSNPAGFDAFLDAYPDGYRRNKKEAADAWRHLNPSEELIEVILSALEAQKASSLWQAGRGIPSPANWLKRERWLDEVPPQPAKAVSPTGDAGGMAGGGTAAGYRSAVGVATERQGKPFLTKDGRCLREVNGAMEYVPVPDDEIPAELQVEASARRAKAAQEAAAYDALASRVAAPKRDRRRAAIAESRARAARRRRHMAQGTKTATAVG